MSRELALQVRDLNVWYRPGGVIRRSRLVPVLHDISFDLWRGEALGLVGESGSGKSTLARVVTVAGQPVRMSASVGATMTAPGTTLQALMNRADEAMYQSKRRRDRRPVFLDMPVGPMPTTT